MINIPKNNNDQIDYSFITVKIGTLGYNYRIDSNLLDRIQTKIDEFELSNNCKPYYLVISHELLDEMMHINYYNNIPIMILNLELIITCKKHIVEVY